MQIFGRLRITALIAVLTCVSLPMMAGCEADGAAQTRSGPQRVGASYSANQGDRDLREEREVEWTRYEIDSEKTIRVFFQNGDPKCYGARAELEESSSSISIAVIVGVLPDAPETCLMVGVESWLLVNTREPIGSRAIENAE